MSKIQLSTYPATVDRGFVSVAFNIGRTQPDPLPSRVIDATQTWQVLAEIDRMKAEGEALPHKPGFVISARVIEGRAPANFKSYCGGWTQVNCGGAA